MWPVLFLHFFTLEDGTDRLSQNFSKELPPYTVYYPRRAQVSMFYQLTCTGQKPPGNGCLQALQNCGPSVSNLFHAILLACGIWRWLLNSLESVYTSSVVEDSGLLGCDAVLLGECFSMFWRNEVPSSSVVEGSGDVFVDLLNLEVKGAVFSKCLKSLALHTTAQHDASGNLSSLYTKL